MKLKLLLIFILVTFAENTIAQKIECAKHESGTGQVIGNDIVTDDLENIYTTRYFSETVNFDPSSCIYLIEIHSNGQKAVLKIIK